MSGNAQKTPFVRTINEFGHRKAQDAISILGKSLPATVVDASACPIVVVKFEVQSVFTLPQISVPMFGPEYIRYPIQAGCKGVVFPVDVSIGAMSGLGGGTASMAQQANLSTLVFFPIGNAGWEAPESRNKIVLYGPDGAVIRMADKSVSIDLSADGVIIKGDLRVIGRIIAEQGITLANGGDLVATGDVIAGDGTADRVTLQAHLHSGVQSGGSNTAEPVPGT